MVQGSDIEDLRKFCADELWGGSRHTGEQVASKNRLKVIEAADQINGNKANLVVAAMIAEGVAVLFVAGGVFSLLIASIR